VYTSDGPTCATFEPKETHATLTSRRLYTPDDPALHAGRSGVCKREPGAVKLSTAAVVRRKASDGPARCDRRSDMHKCTEPTNQPTDNVFCCYRPVHAGRSDVKSRTVRRVYKELPDTTQDLVQTKCTRRTVRRVTPDGPACVKTCCFVVLSRK